MQPQAECTFCAATRLRKQVLAPASRSVGSACFSGFGSGSLAILSMSREEETGQACGTKFALIDVPAVVTLGTSFSWRGLVWTIILISASEQ